MPLIRDAPDKWSLADLVALEGLRPLIPGYVPWTSWSMRPAAIATVANDAILKGRTSIVELGAGASSLILASVMRVTGGHLVSVEQDAGFAVFLNRLLDRYGLSSHASVVHVDLGPIPDQLRYAHPDYQPLKHWYRLEQLLAALPDEIDTLVVDGPPAGDQGEVMVREPAVSALTHRLTPSFSIFLDDADRPAERQTLTRWEEQLDLEFTIVERIALGIGSTDGGFFLTL